MTKTELCDFVGRLANNVVAEELKHRVNETNRLFYNAICLMEHDKNGYGKKRLRRVVEDLDAVLDAYTRGLISIDDMETTLADEVKFCVFVESEALTKDEKL